MSRLYVPGPERRPLLLRRPRWAGGLPVAAILALAIAGVPIVYGATLLVVELQAALDPGPAAR